MRSWLVACLVACSRPPLESCSDDLGGVYADAAGARWMIVDNHELLEAYPLFDDFRAGDPYAAPRALDFHWPDLMGETHRRYTHGGEHCAMHAPLRVTACIGDRLELVTSDPPAPLAFPGCNAPPPEGHVERWSRVR